MYIKRSQKTFCCEMWQYDAHLTTKIKIAKTCMSINKANI